VVLLPETTAVDAPTFEYPPAPWQDDPGQFDGVPPDTATPSISRSHWRAAVSAVLAATAIVCLVVGNVALWMRQDVYSARNVGQEAQQIMGSSDVQHAVADLFTTRVVQPAIDHAGLGPFTGLVSGPVMSLARRVIDDAVASQPAQHMAARLVEQVVPELDKGTGPVALSPQQLAWIVSPSLASNHLVAPVLRAAEQTGCCRVVLVQRGHLSFAWRHVRGIRTAGVVLPTLSLALAALAIVISRRRVRMAMILATAAVATGLVTFASLWAGPGLWGGLMSQPGQAAGVVRAAQRTVFDGATRGLRQHSLLLAGVGASVLAALAASRWLKSSQVMTRS
jgi:hypothetical protein